MAPRVTTVSIGRAGRDVIRRHGVDGITMRSVAAELGVTPMALYRCVDTAEDLRLITVDFALRLVPSPPADGSARERLEAWAVGARPVLRRFAGLADVCLTDWPSMRQGCRMVEQLLGVVEAHTKSPRKQVEIANAIFVYVLTRVMAERAVTARGRRRTLPAVEEAPRVFPRLVRHQAMFATVDVETHFQVGLAALLDGLLGAPR
jgi:AcrR family transcriptional regulator